jgi:hypothetical protein
MFMSNISSHGQPPGIRIATVSATGDIKVNSTLLLQAVVVNTNGWSHTHDYGVVLPPGIVNKSPTLISNIYVAGESIKLINFTILINSTGDFELLFYDSSGGGINSYYIAHLLVQSFPSALPSNIIINETLDIDNTIYINNTIPVNINATIPVYANINISNVLNNENFINTNISTICNTTVYNNLINNITNTIYNTYLANISNAIYNEFIANITQYFNITQWQQQWQWQNVTIIFPSDDGQQTFLYMMAGAGILGVFFLGSATTSIEKVTRIKEEKKKSKWATLASPLTSQTSMLNRRFKFGLATVLAATLTTLGTLAVFPSLGFSFAYSVTFGLLLGAIGFIIIASLNAPRGLIALLPIIDIGLWLWDWRAGLTMLIIVLVLFAIFIIYMRQHKTTQPGTTTSKKPLGGYARKGLPEF